MKLTNYLNALSIVFCAASCSMKPQQGYIGPSEITVQDGKMSPEVLLSLGRLSDPRLSPDGKKILYGVSYTSIKDNRSVRNLFFSPLDGGNKVQLTFDGKSISCARWSKDGNSVYFIQGGQIYKAPFKAGKLGKKVKISDVPEGISEFEFSPDESQIMYVSSVKSAVQTPSDSDPALDKATAYATEDLMYRHWDHWVETIDHTYICPAGGGMITKDRSLDILGGPDVLYQLPNGPFGGIEQLSWSPDGRYVAYSCKKLTGKEYAFSTNTEIFIYCILTGETTKISDGGGYDTDPVWSPDGKAIAWLHMERDGYEADKTDLFLAELQSEEEGEGQTSNPAALNIRNLTSGFAYNVAGPVWA